MKVQLSELLNKVKTSGFFQKFFERFYIKLFFIFVILPLVLLGIYYIFIASDGYVSKSIVTIKATGEKPPSFSLGFLSFGNPTLREEAYFLKEFILSYDMLEYLDKTTNLKKIYTNPKIDFFSRLSPDATKEEFLEYYRDHIEVLYDEISSILYIKVKAYTPEEAQKINQTILTQCERYLNAISHKIAREQINFIEKELGIANQKNQAAKQKLISFQNTYKILDPTQEAQALSNLIAQLEAQLASKEAELQTLLTYLSENSFQVQNLKEQIKALKNQIEKEKARLVGGSNNRLNRLALEYLTLKLEAEFYADVYKATLSAYEQTRVEASRKLKNLVIIQAPNLPEEPLYPKKVYNLTLAFILLLMFYGIIVFLIEIIKEHMV